MRPPAFWNAPPDKPGVWSQLLSPLGALYAALTARRLAKGRPIHVRVPVICVGNVNAGGTGKTPTVIALMQMLNDLGKTVHVVSRGYGGSLEGPVQVDPRNHDAAQVGDEPLLLAAFGTVWVAKDRAQGALSAELAGADVVLVDDGLQNPGVAKDLSLIVVDASQGFGNGRCIPAGPLREPVAAAMARADLVLSIGPEDTQTQFAETWDKQITLPHLSGYLLPLQTGMDWQDTPVLAFAGIGRPEKLFQSLEQAGGTVIRRIPFPDHHNFTVKDANHLTKLALADDLQLVTIWRTNTNNCC